MVLPAINLHWDWFVPVFSHVFLKIILFKAPQLDGSPILIFVQIFSDVFPIPSPISSGFSDMFLDVSHIFMRISQDFPWISHRFPSHPLPMARGAPPGAAPRSPWRCRRPARHRPGPWDASASAATRRPGDVHLREELTKVTDGYMIVVNDSRKLWSMMINDG